MLIYKLLLPVRNCLHICMYRRSVKVRNPCIDPHIEFTMFEMVFKGNLIMLGAMFIATKKKKKKKKRKNLLQGFNTNSEIKIKT